MHLGVFVSSQMDMYLGRLLVEVCRVEVDDLAPRGRQRMHISREGRLQEGVGQPTLMGGMEPLWSRNASRRIRTREKFHSIVYRTEVQLVEMLVEGFGVDAGWMRLGSLIFSQASPWNDARLTRLDFPAR